MADTDAQAQAAVAAARSAGARRGLLLCLGVAFGVAWALWGVMWATGGLVFRPVATGFILASTYAPTLGVLAAWRFADPDAVRLSDVGQWGAWRWYLAALVLVPVLIVLGMLCSVALGVQQLHHFDSAMGLLRADVVIQNRAATMLPSTVLSM